MTLVLENYIELAPIRARGEDEGLVIRAVVDRYFSLLDAARRNLQGKFAEAELSLMIDISNGTYWQGFSIPYLYAEVEDSFPDGTCEKWEIDGPALVEKLKALPLAETYALVDAIERFWHGVGEGQQPPYASLLDDHPVIDAE